MSLSRYFLALFVLLALAELAVIHFGMPYRWISKPLIMTSLIVFFWCQTMTGISYWTRCIFIGALACALSGDIFLLTEGNFVFGLLAFFVMQVGYIVCFCSGRNFYGRREISFSLFLVVAVSLIIFFLWPHLGRLKIPVIFYTLAIATMALIAFTRDNTRPGYLPVLLGAVLFMISDTLLAFGQFVPETPKSGWAIMPTYMAAQYLIVSGYIRFLHAQR